MTHREKREARIERIAGRVARLEAAKADLWRRVDEQKAEHDAWIGSLLVRLAAFDLPGPH